MNYKKLYNTIIKNASNRVIEGYTETHHITPRCLGGTDDKDNLVKLTAKEHFICHLLLTKMYPKGSLEYYKMCHAFMMMLVSSKNNQRYITSKKYEILKKDYSKIISNIQSGKGNSQFGTMWIHNLKLKECKKVPKNSIIEEGWIKGRIVYWNKTIKPKTIKIYIPKEKKIYVKQCVQCDEEFTTTNNNKSCCTRLCGNLQSTKFAVLKNKKKVIINEVVYDSLHDAATALNLTPEGVSYRIKNGLGGSFL